MRLLSRKKPEIANRITFTVRSVDGFYSVHRCIPVEYSILQRTTRQYVISQKLGTKNRFGLQKCKNVTVHRRDGDVDEY